MMRNTTNDPVKAAATQAAATEATLPETSIGESTPPTAPTLGDDILFGADEISEFVFGDTKHRRKVYHLTGDARNSMPYFKIGSITCARKSTLLRWVEEQEERTIKHHSL